MDADGTYKISSESFCDVDTPVSSERKLKKLQRIFCVWKQMALI